jgi:hypothetical protein
MIRPQSLPTCSGSQSYQFALWLQSGFAGTNAWARSMQERAAEQVLEGMMDELEAQWAQTLGPCLRVAVLCGGSGLGREASMDCARTVVAQLDTLARFTDGEAMFP